MPQDVSNRANNFEAMNRLGEKLGVLRERHGLSLKQLGDKLGVSKSYIWKMEQGQKMPNGPMILKIADLFGVTTDQLMRDELELD
jgi:transcriptional regulator with XRE-family HTH domain